MIKYFGRWNVIQIRMRQWKQFGWFSYMPTMWQRSYRDGYMRHSWSFCLFCAACLCHDGSARCICELSARSQNFSKDNCACSLTLMCQLHIPGWQEGKMCGWLLVTWNVKTTCQRNIKSCFLFRFEGPAYQEKERKKIPTEKDSAGKMQIQFILNNRNILQNMWLLGVKSNKNMCICTVNNLNVSFLSEPRDIGKMPEKYRNNWSFWKTYLFSFLQKIRCEDRCHSHVICMSHICSSSQEPISLT